jgi:mannose/fructose/N-acetylgalactosamine-specific phosphotransferase system component IID
MIVAIAALIGFFIATNFYVSYKINVSDFFTQQQKFLQFIMVWILPFLGAFIVLLILVSHKKSQSESMRLLENEEHIPGIAGSYDTEHHG